MNASIDVLTLFLFNIVLVNIPLLYGTVGEIVTEKAGSLNLGVEGTMAIGAIFGYLAGCMANSLLVGLLVSFLAAGLCGALFALLTVSLQANQNVTGLTITTFGLGLYFFIGKGLGDRWPVMTSADALVSGFSAREIPLLSSPGGGQGPVFPQHPGLSGHLGGGGGVVVPHLHQDRPAPALRGGEPRRCRLGGRQHPAV